MLAMKCESCEGRWVALVLGSTIGGGRVSYHFASESLRCPRCGDEGIVDGDVLMKHQQHPEVVAVRGDQLPHVGYAQ